MGGTSPAIWALGFGAAPLPNCPLKGQFTTTWMSRWKLGLMVTVGPMGYFTYLYMGYIGAITH